jgi:hypothetical protein
MSPWEEAERKSRGEEDDEKGEGRYVVRVNESKIRSASPFLPSPFSSPPSPLPLFFSPAASSTAVRPAGANAGASRSGLHQGRS